MPSLHDDAVVLRLTEYSESSQIVTLFSARHGLLRLIARGARRSTRTRFVPGLDLLELGEVGYLPAHGDAQLGTLTDWTQRQAFTGLRRDPLRLYAGMYSAELVAGLTEGYDPHPDLFWALVTLLAAVAGNRDAAPAIAVFQRDLLRAIGYAPQVEACVECRRAVSKGAAVFFSSAAGGLLCRDCEKHHVEKRRVPPGLVGTTPATGPPRHWFDLFDYHLTQVAGRRFRTAATLAALLAGQSPGGL